jgi:transposase
MEFCFAKLPSSTQLSRKFARKLVCAVGGGEALVVKRNELHKFVVLPKRWVVERSFGWLEKNHRLWKNCERKIHNTLEMTVLAFISLLLKRY